MGVVVIGSLPIKGLCEIPFVLYFGRHALTQWSVVMCISTAFLAPTHVMHR